ncbi:ABC transporter permease [Priestia aryabhattai]|uniref:ABC transporter permease n=1 Tax=Priestia aryabhattai TaxID=412384 RepID=A0AAX6N858_PRIAR|nr:FtsX-like permease family protein [Priestia aryabhattai]MDU9691979.1 ABC transporter permease [Priestia aryabhattai]
MSLIFSLANSFLKSKKSRTILSIIGISIGFMLLISSNILMSTLEKSNENIVEEKYGNYDLIVGYQKSSLFLNNSDVDKINEFDNVQQTSPFLYPYIGKGNPYKKEIEIQPMYVGLKNDSLSKEHEFTKLSSGHLPGKSEVVIPYSWAKAKNLKIGSKLTFPFPPNEEKTVRVSGIMKKSEYLHSVVLFQYDWLAKATSQNNHVTTLMIKLNDWHAKGQVINQLKEIDPNFFIDRQIKMDKEREQLGGLKPVVQGLNIAVLIGSALLLISTLQMSIQEKKKELATLRLLGAKKSQIAWLVISESVIIATLSAILGVIFGIGISFILKGIITRVSGISVENIYIEWHSIMYSVLLGILITIVASIIPATLASKLSPIQAYRQSIDTEHKTRIVLPAISVCLVFLSVALSFFNYIKIHDPKIYILSAAILILSTFVGISFLLKCTVKVLSFIIKPFLKQYSLLASRNTIRQLRRSIQIAGVTMLGVIISIVGISVLTTVRDTTEKSILMKYPLSHVIDSNSEYDEPGLPLTFYKQVDSIPGVKSVPVYKDITVFTQNFDKSNVKKNSKLMLYNVNKESEVMTALQGVDFNKMKNSLPLKVTKGSINTNELNQGGVVITDYGSKVLGYKLGDYIKFIHDTELNFKEDKLEYKDEKSKEQILRLKVVGIIKDYPMQEGPDIGIYTSPEFMKKRFNIDSINEVYYKILDKKSQSDIENKIETLIGSQPSSKVILYNRQTELQTLYNQFNQRVAILLSCVVLICLLAMIGLMNGMASSLQERSREFATIRALGSKTKSIVRLTLVEGAMVTLGGGILGVLFGSILLNQLLLSLDNNSVTLPWKMILICLIITPIMGLIATLIPALYLSKRDILKELSE